MKSFLSIYFQTFYNPRKSFEELRTTEHSIKLSFLFILIPVALYTLMYVFLTMANGAPSSLTPWLNIPKEEYYSLNRFLLAPSMIICWFTATSFIQVAGRLLGGQGSFEHTLTVVAMSISIAMWGSLIHDLPMSFLSAIGVIDAAEHEIAMNSPTIFRTLLWISYSIYLFAFLILFSLSVRVVHKLNWFLSTLTGTFAFILFQTLFLVFNR